VAGAAREHPGVLAAGLLLSILLMGLAANLIGGLLRRHRWIGYAGLFVVLVVAGRMVWDGGRALGADPGIRQAYDGLAPGPLRLAPNPRPTQRPGS
jgi:predicted tellurium resistance membrane protein TerC